jgi:small subunit ribosomal protein S17
VSTLLSAQTAGDAGRKIRRLRQGVVSSDKGNKTIKVLVEWSVKHKKYGKYMKRRTVLHAHDEKNEAAEGDRVEVMECRPVSKTKSWRLVRIIGRK